jgi:hypothetical protein
LDRCVWILIHWEHQSAWSDATDIPYRALDAVVQRCLAKDPRDGYGPAAELAKDLVPALARSEGAFSLYGLTMPDSLTLPEWNRP